MLQNYLKVVRRSLLRHKGYSLLIVGGLAAGLAAAILIMLLVRYELSYDSCFEPGSQLVRLEYRSLNAAGEEQGGYGSLGPAFTPLLKRDFPEIERIVRFIAIPKTLLTSAGQKYIEDRGFLAEEDFFKVFSLRLLQGDPATALRGTNGLVLSESLARKYFGRENPLGKQIMMNGQDLFQVTGVMPDTPPNAHVHFDFVGSLLSLKGRYVNDGDDYFFGSRNFSDNVTYTYLRLAPGTAPESFASLLPAFLDRAIPPGKMESGDMMRASQAMRIIVRRVSDIHLQSHTMEELEANSDRKYVMLFTLIAVFIVLIACVNFTNLTTARAAGRVREIGLRKMAGALRRGLFMQFITETLMLTFLALILALGLVLLALPQFRTLTGRELTIGLLFQAGELWWTAALFLGAAFAAGLYPALYLSSFNPAAILRRELSAGHRAGTLRRVLVVFQFVICTGLMIAVGIIFQQMRFLQNSSLGFDRQNVVLLPLNESLQKSWTGFKQRLLANPRFTAATLSKRAPSGRLQDDPGYRIELNGKQLDTPFSMPHNRVEKDFFRTFGMKIVAGRDFSDQYATDGREAFIVNETAVRKLGLARPEDAVGKAIAAGGRQGRIIGVVADFNYESLHFAVVPILTYIQETEADTVAVRIAPGNPQATLEQLQTIWEQFVPQYPFQYQFLDDRLSELYGNEARMMKVFGYFSVFAIFIACLGLFGMASFSAERRKKEIGVRKVLGASESGIVELLSRDFLKPVLLANLIAWPLAYLLMNQWLQAFAYRISIGPGMFFLAGLAAMVIALLTVSGQTIRAARANPADTLRAE